MKNIKTIYFLVLFVLGSFLSVQGQTAKSQIEPYFDGPLVQMVKGHGSSSAEFSGPAVQLIAGNTEAIELSEKVTTEAVIFKGSEAMIIRPKKNNIEDK